MAEKITDCNEVRKTAIRTYEVRSTPKYEQQPYERTKYELSIVRSSYVRKNSYFAAMWRELIKDRKNLL